MTRTAARNTIIAYMIPVQNRRLRRRSSLVVAHWALQVSAPTGQTLPQILQ